jgi:hypothetical protein
MWFVREKGSYTDLVKDEFPTKKEIFPSDEHNVMQAIDIWESLSQSGNLQIK